MAQEEHHRCSNSSSSGVRPSRKLKQKKIPQRGLGVAQLEKIRLEEQKKDSHHNHQSSSSIVFSPHSPSDLSSFRPSPPISPSNFDVLSPPAPPLPPPTLLYGHNCCDHHDVVGGSAIGASGTAAMVEEQGQGQEQAYLPTMWNSCELNSEAESYKLDLGSEYGQHLRNESNQIWPPVLTQRKQEEPQQQQHQPPPSPKVNLSVSISQSSAQNFLLEPPSIQSYYSNYTTPLWPEEYKMVGIKRQWPFSLDNPPCSKLDCKFPPLIPLACGNGGNGAHSFEPKGSIFREGPSSSTSFHHLDWREGLSELNLKENGALDTILTLGPSATSTSSSLASKAKQPLELPAYHFQEFQEFKLLPVQGYTEDLLRLGGSIQQQPFYSFFPSKRHQISTSTATSNEQICKPEEGLDLTLKL